MTFLNELANELAILFAADLTTYAEYVESVVAMEDETVETMVRIHLVSWEYRRKLKRIRAELIRGGKHQH